MEDQWLALAKRLQAIASTGMYFGESEFDKERYAEVNDIASRMLADLGNRPLNLIPNLFPDYAQGYATPKVDVRGAVIRENSILLVRERLDGLWTLPGGYADVGLSAAENTVKEVREECGLDVSIRQLMGVFHKAKHEYNDDPRDFYKFYFLCDETSAQEPSTGPETMDVGFFKRNALPPLSLGRSIEKHIDLAFDYLANPGTPTVFD